MANMANALDYAYVTEDGLTYYRTEDGVSVYVQESYVAPPVIANVYVDKVVIRVDDKPIYSYS